MSFFVLSMNFPSSAEFQAESFKFKLISQQRRRKIKSKEIKKKTPKKRATHFFLKNMKTSITN